MPKLCMRIAEEEDSYTISYKYEDMDSLRALDMARNVEFECRRMISDESYTSKQDGHSTDKSADRRVCAIWADAFGYVQWHRQNVSVRDCATIAAIVAMMIFEKEVSGGRKADKS